MSTMRMRLWIVIALAIAAGAGVSGGEAPRVAVLEVGPSGQVPAALLDMLWLQIAQQDDLVLLERAEVDRLLQEQEWALLASGQREDIPAASAVAAGRLWGVDLFVLIESSGEAREEALRVRMVETRYGIKLDDMRLPTPMPAQFESSAAQITARIRSLLSRVTVDPAEMRLVGVLAFRNIEPTTEWDHLADEIHAGLEQQLMLQPGIIVAERERTRPVSDERELVSDLPEALRATVLVVNGEYRVSDEDSENLVVDVQGRRDNVQLFEERVEGPRDELYAINVAIAEIVSERLGRVPTTRAMNARMEADMLIEQAKVAPDFATAMGAIEAAIALVPDEDAYRLAYLSRVGRHTLQGLDRKETRCPVDGGPHPLRMQQVHRYMAMAAPLVEKWLRIPADVPASEFNPVLQHLPRLLGFLEPGDQALPEVRDLLQGRIRPMVERIRLAHLPYELDDIAERERLLKHLLGIYQAIGAASVDEAHEFLNFAFDHMGAKDLRGLNRYSIWPADLDPDRRFELDRRLFEFMLEHDRADVVLVGKRGLAQMHASGVKPDYALARRYYEQFERFFLESFLTPRNEQNNIPHFRGSWVLPFLNVRAHNRSADSAVPEYRFYEDEAANLNYRAERAARVFEEVANYPYHLLHAHWLFSAGDVRVLEQAGHIEETDRILTLYIQRMKEVVADHPRERSVHLVRDSISRLESARDRLQEEHPELKRTSKEVPAVSEWRATRLFSLNEAVASLGSARSFSARHLVMEHGMAAVVGSQGVLFMDSQSLTPARYVAAPDGVSLGTRYAADDDGIYTVSADGIVFFPLEGESRLFFEDHPDLSEGIHDMDVLEGSVYVLVGEASGYMTGETLLQFDLKQANRRIVLSARAELGDRPLGNIQGIYHIAADPVNNWLRVHANGSEGTAYLAYHPETRAFSRLPGFNKPVMIAELKNRRRGKELITWGVYEVAFYDMKWEERLAIVVSRQSRFDSYNLFARVHDGMIGNFPHMGQLNYFSAGSGEPEDIRSEVFPPSGESSPAVRDMWMHERGLIVLGRHDLYAVTGIKDRIKAHFAERVAPELFLERWRDLPMGPEKIRSYFNITTQERTAGFVNEAMSLSLEGLDPDIRKESILTFLELVEHERRKQFKRLYPAYYWIEEVRADEWRDPDIRDALIDLLATDYRITPLRGIYLNRLIKHIPADLDLSHWTRKIDSAVGKRKLAMVAMLVKTGHPEFIDLLLAQADHESIHDTFLRGVVRNLGNHEFSHLQPQLAVAVAAIIDERGAESEGRPNIADLRKIANLPESKEALAPYADSENPELALAVGFMLVNSDKDEYLPRLENALARDDIETIAQNREDVVRLIRRLRAKAMLNPEQEDRYHKRILEWTEYRFAIYESIEEAPHTADLWDLSRFIANDLQAFGLYPDIRCRLINYATSYVRRRLSAATVRAYNSYYAPVPVVARALVNDAEYRGDLDALMAEREKAVTEGDRTWGPRLLLMHLRVYAEHPDPLEMFREDLWVWLRREDAPRSLIRQAWSQEPEEVLRILPFADLMEAINIYSRHLGPELVQKLLENLEDDGDKQTIAAFRLVHGLPVDEMPNWTFSGRRNCKISRLAGLNSPAIRETDWTPYLLTSGRQVIGERGYGSSPDRVPRFLHESATLYLKSSRTRESMKESDSMVADFIRGMAALHEGDIDKAVAVIDRYAATREWRPEPRRRRWFEKLKWRADLAKGQHLDSIEGWWYRDIKPSSHVHEMRYVLIESGYPQTAWDLIQAEYAHITREASSFRRYIPCHLAWLAARIGQWDAAREIAMEALNYPETKNLADYALMQVNLFTEQLAALRDYVDILNLRPWKTRTEYTETLTRFAESTDHPDLKALAAFQAGRIAYAADKESDARRLWHIGAETSGLHSKYCRTALEGLSTKRPMTKLTTGWYDEDAAPARFFPVNRAFGITSRDGEKEVRLQNVVFLDPYGVPVSTRRRQTLDRLHSGWWLYIRDQPPAWLHGEWTLVAPHADGVDVHHRTLVPFVRKGAEGECND